MTRREGQTMSRLFQETVSLLQGAGLGFWLEFGALLGLVRGGSLISWDHDIDLGMWRDEVDEEVITRIFEGSSLAVRRRPESDYYHIYRSGWTTQEFIDLNLYERKADRAVYTVCFSRLNPRQRLAVLWCDFLAGQEHYPHKNRLAKRIQQGLYLALGRGLGRLLPGDCRLRLKGYSARLQDRRKAYAIYDFPARFFEELTDIELFGLRVKIPRDTEGYLETAYGRDWRVPRKWNHWSEGASYIVDRPIPGGNW